MTATFEHHVIFHLGNTRDDRIHLSGSVKRQILHGLEGATSLTHMGVEALIFRPRMTGSDDDGILTGAE
jgi:hypothetical protein